jgi:tetratricopeptide (TPR) repeat protein
MTRQRDCGFHAAPPLALAGPVGELFPLLSIASERGLIESADAIIAARQKIVHGAVSMVEMALKDLSERQVVDFSRDVVSMLYADRGWIYVRMGKSREALDDVNKAVELHPTAENLNTRAYARAVLNIELNEGLADIDKALRENGENDADHGSAQQIEMLERIVEQSCKPKE